MTTTSLVSSERTFEIGARRYGARLAGGTTVGSTSTIYLARRIADSESPPGSRAGVADGRELILKRFFEKEKERFEVERDVLSRAAEFDGTGSGRHFPRLEAAGEQYFEGTPGYLLVMEHAGEQTVDGLVPLPEREALLLTGHYLECLTALSRAGFSCWDRKFKDFFWTRPVNEDDTGKLVVVDWNMAEPCTVGRMGYDLGVAGQLLYELLTGEPLARRPGSAFYDPDASARWKRVSFGAQRIVRDLLAGAREIVRGREDDEEGRDALRARMEQIRERCSEIAEIWTTPPTPLMGEAEERRDADRPLEALCRSSVAVLRVVGEGRGWDEEILDEWASSSWKTIHDWARSRSATLRDPLAAVRACLRDADARGCVGHCEELLSGSAVLSLEQELSVRRRLLASRACLDAGAARPAYTELSKALDAVESGARAGGRADISSALQAVGSVPGGPNTALGKVLELFRRELAVRGFVSRAVESRERNELKSALGDYSSAREELRSMDGSEIRGAGEYVGLVRESLGDIDAAVRDLEEVLHVVEGPREALDKAREYMKSPCFEFQEALRVLEKGKQFDPGSTEIAELYNVVWQLAGLQSIVLRSGDFRDDLREIVMYAENLMDSVGLHAEYPKYVLTVFEKKLGTTAATASVDRWQAKIKPMAEGCGSNLDSVGQNRIGVRGIKDRKQPLQPSEEWLSVEMRYRKEIARIKKQLEQNRQRMWIALGCLLMLGCFTIGLLLGPKLRTLVLW